MCNASALLNKSYTATCCLQHGHPELVEGSPGKEPCSRVIDLSMPTNINTQPTPHTNQRKPPSAVDGKALKSLLFISQREIKSGIHEPRIGNAVPAGDAGECDTPAKV